MYNIYIYMYIYIYISINKYIYICICIYIYILMLRLLSVVCWSCPVVSARKHKRRGGPDNNAEEGLTGRKHNQSRRMKKVCRWGGLRPPQPPPLFFFPKLSAHERTLKRVKREENTINREG